MVSFGWNQPFAGRRIRYQKGIFFSVCRFTFTHAINKTHSGNPYLFMFRTSFSRCAMTGVLFDLQYSAFDPTILLGYCMMGGGVSRDSIRT